MELKRHEWKKESFNPKSKDQFKDCTALTDWLLKMGDDGDDEALLKRDDVSDTHVYVDAIYVSHMCLLPLLALSVVAGKSKVGLFFDYSPW